MSSFKTAHLILLLADWYFSPSCQHKLNRIGSHANYKFSEQMFLFKQKTKLALRNVIARFVRTISQTKLNPAAEETNYRISTIFPKKNNFKVEN